MTQFPKPTALTSTSISSFDSPASPANRVASPPSNTPKDSFCPSTCTTDPVALLILGAGWTSQFLLPLLQARKISHAETTRSGHDDTIPFTFDPAASRHDTAPYERLPPATTILITFPLKGPGQSKLLTHLYNETHPAIEPNWIQLGSTGIFTAPEWNDSCASYDTSNQRAIAEDELLSLLGTKACVLNLAGLYGGERQPRNWLTRVAKTKEDVQGKGALHLIHGRDVARAIVCAHEVLASLPNSKTGLPTGEDPIGSAADDRSEPKLPEQISLHPSKSSIAGKRHIITDLHVYDWWDLFQTWGAHARDAAHGYLEDDGDEDVLQYERWVLELMREEGVRALPRDGGDLGRRLDGRGFWEAVGCYPEEGRVV